MSPGSAALGAVLVSIAVIALIALVAQRRLGKHRGVSRDQFVGAFTETDVGSEIPSAVYDYYKSSVISEEFSVAPDDDYEQVLSKGDEDIDDDARFLIKKLGLRMPADYSSARAEARIRTLRDMVVWLNG